jgi:Protein of unknown function (DUF5818)
MKKQIQSLWFLSALALFLSVGISLSAQNSAPSTSAPDTQAQPAQSQAPDAQATPTQEGQPSQTPATQAQPSQTPDTQAPATQTQENQPSQTPDASGQATGGSQNSSATGVQSFSGTVLKSGDKYMLKDEASGNTYDIDHQDEVQKFEGKRVKVHGTLDASGKMIHLQ